jgi:peptide/nickel transport system substrate-binding protein
VTLTAVGALALGLAACSSSGGTTTGGTFANGKTFTQVIGTDPGTLDPHFTALASAGQVDRFLYDSLVNVDAKGVVSSGLAEKWDGTSTTATYTLRKNVTCADGTPLKASTVAENITFVGDPANASTAMGTYVPPGTTAKGDDAAGTVTVTSAAPDPFLSRNVGGLLIVCDKGLKDRSLLKQGSAGTGMFTLGEAVASDHYTLNRRTDYAWGPGDWKSDVVGLPDKVVFRVVGNETTTANLLLSKEVNASTIVGPDRERLQAQQLFKREQVAPLGQMWFNQKAGLPGADESVRRALTQALDLNQLGQVLTGGTGQASTGLVAPGGPCDQNTVASNLPAHNADAAKSALDGAGWTAGAGGARAKAGQKLTLALYYPTSIGAGMQASAELAQKTWQALGIEVTLKPVTDAEIGQLIVGGQGAWDVTFLPLTVSLPTQLVPFLSGPTPPNGVNFAGITNADYATNVQAASAAVGAAGCDKWAAAEVSLFKHVDLVPFVNSAVPVFGAGATFELSQNGVMPSSIRMLV